MFEKIVPTGPGCQNDQLPDTVKDRYMDSNSGPGEHKGFNVESREVSQKLRNLKIADLTETQIQERLVSLQTSIAELETEKHKTVSAGILKPRFDVKKACEVKGNAYSEALVKRHAMLSCVWSRVLSERLYQGTTEEYGRYERSLHGKIELYDIVIKNKKSSVFDREEHQLAIKEAEEYTNKEVSLAFKCLMFWQKISHYEKAIERREELRISRLTESSELLRSEVKEIINFVGDNIVRPGLSESVSLSGKQSLKVR